MNGGFAVSSIFLDFNLPNSTTWFYFSFFLTVALFFQFGRLLTLRNWDLLALFLFGPGFLLLLEANQLAASADRAERERFIGYAWLLGASAYWFGRCLFDLATVKRPLISPNLSTPGLVWFGGSLFVCLTAVAFIRPADQWQPIGKQPAALAGVEEGAAVVVSQARTGTGDEAPEALFWVERSFTMLCHLAVVLGLVLIGWRLFRDAPTGVAAGTLYLLIPYTAFHIGQVHHVWPAALILWAVYLYRFPLAAGSLIGLAAGTAFFPVLLVPVWMQFYRTHGLLRFLIGLLVFGAGGLGGTLLVLYLTDQFPEGVWRTLNLSDWQPWRVPTAESLWASVHWAYRLPVFIAYAGFVLASWVWPPVRNLGHLIAVSAAVIIGIQFWFADRGGLYVMWYAPLLVLVVLRPNLVDLEPVPPRPFPRFVSRPARWLWRRVRPAKPPTPSPLAVR
jgi:hypothetical protein